MASDKRNALKSTKRLFRFHGVFKKEEVTHSCLFSFYFGGLFGVCLHSPTIASDSIWRMMNGADHLSRASKQTNTLAQCVCETFYWQIAPMGPTFSQLIKTGTTDVLPRQLCGVSYDRRELWGLNSYQNKYLFSSFAGRQDCGGCLSTRLSWFMAVCEWAYGLVCLPEWFWEMGRIRWYLRCW